MYPFGFSVPIISVKTAIPTPEKDKNLRQQEEIVLQIKHLEKVEESFQTGVNPLGAPF